MTGRLKARRRRSLIQDLRQGTCTGKKVRSMLKCDFCGKESDNVTRVAIDKDYDRLTVRHEKRYACPDSSEQKEKEVRAGVPERFGIFRQEGALLGQRMRNAFSRLLSSYEKVSMTGTDSPDLPISLISDSFDRLDSSDAVLRPAKDGGYYLVALKKPADVIFYGLKWGGGTGLAASL